MEGIFIRAMAIMAPGIFLSQPPTASRPSTLCAWQTVSIESAITSRDTRLYFIPSVPIEIPSLTVMVPNTWGIVPAFRKAVMARSVRRFRPMLQGVIVLYPLATPTIGLLKSSSPKPTARSIARFGVRSAPSVIFRLLLLFMKRADVRYASACHDYPRRLHARKRQVKAYRTYDRFPFNSSPYRPAGLPRATASSRAVVRQHVQSGVALFPPRAGE